MNKAEKNEVLLDSLLKISLTEAFEKEIAELPSIEELNKKYKSSNELDKRINALIKKSNKKSKLKRISKRFGVV